MLMVICCGIKVIDMLTMSKEEFAFFYPSSHGIRSDDRLQKLHGLKHAAKVYDFSAASSNLIPAVALLTNL